MGGRDKAWLRWSGQPLICHAVDRLTPQVDTVVVSANRHRWAYRRIGVETIPDRDAWRGRGPLAAIASVLSDRRPSRLAVVPVDAPCAPRDHVLRLAAALNRGARAAALHDGRRQQPLFCLLDCAVLESACEALNESTVPSMRAWLDHLAAVWIDYAETDAFANINTPDELKALQDMA